MEWLALARLCRQVTQSENFNIAQSAYRQNHSTETALMNILNDAYSNIDKGQSTLMVAVDLSSAFHTVEHSVLLTRLENSFGMTGVAREWIASYLADLKQFVRVGSEACAATSCSCGVLQASVLCPLLFVAYICPVVSVATQFGVSLHQYADDTQLYIALSKSDMNTSVDKLQNCLSTVHLWFSQNGLVINPEKSEAVLLSTSQQARASTSLLTGVNVAGCMCHLQTPSKFISRVFVFSIIYMECISHFWHLY